MGSTRPEAPRIFDFQDYRAFLKAHFAYLRNLDADFSLRVFARRPELRLASSSFLSAVLKGRKNLSQSFRLRFGKALGLKPAEQDYFETLIQADQGKTAEERSHYRSRLARYRGSRARTLSGDEQRLFARWWYPSVWHWIGLHPDQSSPARIAKSIRPPLEPAQAEEALRALLDLKLIKKLANGYAVTERHLAAGPEPGGEKARAHVRDFLRMNLFRLDGPPPDGEESHILSFTTSPGRLERLREKVAALKSELRELAAEPAGPGDRVYALGIHLLPCSEPETLPEGAAPRAPAPAGTSSEIALGAES